MADHGRLSRRVRVRSRYVTLAAVGDVNLGNGPGAYIAQPGVRYSWTSVAPVLRCADVAFGNLECAVSTRGALVPKQFSFRGRPAALRAMGRYAGLDVLNLANNHVGD
jgi:Bacterial capsule synthesis protein PGA_cap